MMPMERRDCRETFCQRPGRWDAGLASVDGLEVGRHSKMVFNGTTTSNEGLGQRAQAPNQGQSKALNRIDLMGLKGKEGKERGKKRKGLEEESGK